MLQALHELDGNGTMLCFMPSELSNNIQRLQNRQLPNTRAAEVPLPFLPSLLLLLQVLKQQQQPLLLTNSNPCWISSSCCSRMKMSWASAVCLTP
jgi:hypothetical protein